MRTSLSSGRQRFCTEDPKGRASGPSRNQPCGVWDANGFGSVEQGLSQNVGEASRFARRKTETVRLHRNALTHRRPKESQDFQFRVERSGAHESATPCGQALKERRSRLWKWNPARLVCRASELGRFCCAFLGPAPQAVIRARLRRLRASVLSHHQKQDNGLGEPSKISRFSRRVRFFKYQIPLLSQKRHQNESLCRGR